MKGKYDFSQLQTMRPKGPQIPVFISGPSIPFKERRKEKASSIIIIPFFLLKFNYDYLLK